MNPNIFRAYDIRGVAGQDMSAADVRLIGLGLGTYFTEHRCRRISVGRDCRLTSDHYSGQLVNGLRAAGCDVVDIGLCPTPVLYFSVPALHLDGGVMVTASHNPPHYNGFKICKGLDSIHGEKLQAIRTIIESRAFNRGNGSLSSADAVTPYRKYLVDHTRLNTPLSVGVDAGNGTAGPLIIPLLEQLGCQVKAIHCEMDGRFPNHPADPTVAENLSDLIKLVRENSLDLGIGYDGDGDRIGVIDDTGSVVLGDQLLMLYAREILADAPGAAIVADVKCSQNLFDDIDAHGGRPVMYKSGHSSIKTKIRDESAALGGELSGHIFFADRYYGYDDALYATCRLLEILSTRGKRLSELRTDLPSSFSTPEIRLECPENRKFDIARKIAERFRATHPVIDIDGVRVIFDHGWALVRASNTQPALVLRFEAETQEGLDSIQHTVESVIGEVQADPASRTSPP